jgi:hypothetical protein
MRDSRVGAQLTGFADAAARRRPQSKRKAERVVQHLVREHLAPHAVAGGAGNHVQRQQVLLGARRVAQAPGRAGGGVPGGQAGVALGRGQGHGVGQPAVELGADRRRARIAVAAHVVVAHAAADDQHAFVAQRRQRLAVADVRLRVQAARGHLQHRHVGVGKGHHQRDEGAVVVAALGVDGGGDAGVRQQAARALGQRRRAGRGVTQLVGVRRKAVVVEQHAGLGRAGQHDLRRQPVRRDQHDGRGLAGRLAGMPRRKAAVLSQASGGFQSMKKQGPAPCGMNAGMREAAAVMVIPIGRVTGFFQGSYHPTYGAGVIRATPIPPPHRPP